MWNTVGVSELKTLRNGLALLRMLEGRPPSAITELAKELAISPSAAHRIASTLVSEGFLEQEPRSRRYMLCGGVVLGHARSELERLLDVAPAHLASLRDSTDETVHIAVRTGMQVGFPLAVESRRQVRVSSSVGRSVPVHAAATGKVLLSHLPDDEIRAMLGSRLEPLTDRTLLTTEALLAELADVRRNGYAVNTSETEDGIYTVAVAIEDARGLPVCALAVSAPLARVRRDPAERDDEAEDRLLDALGLCARELAAELVS
jgi:IclR family acetate operon transcriptional repressor